MRYKSIFIDCIRILLGLTFISSGFLKGIDPVGFGLKIVEYQTHLFGVTTADYIDLATLVGCLFIVFECCIGIFLFHGVALKTTARLSFLLLLALTLTTLYNYIEGAVPDCGCFGDFLPLNPLETLLKNIILLTLNIYLLFNLTRAKRCSSNKSEWLRSGLGIIALSVFLYGNYQGLPYWDFRPYKIGYNIRERISKADSAYYAELMANTQYLYKKGNEKRTFTAHHLPDSTWHFVRMIEANNKPQQEVYSLLILTDQGEDVTQDILRDTVGVFLFASPDWEQARQENYEYINRLYRYAKRNGIKFYSISPSNADSEAEWRYQTGAEYPNLFVDAATLKTMIRSNPGLIVIKNGVIIDKLAPPDFPTSEKTVDYLYTRLILGESGNRTYWRVLLLILWLFVASIGLIRSFVCWGKLLWFNKLKSQNTNT